MGKQRLWRGWSVLALTGLGAAVLAAGSVTAANEDKLSRKEKKKVTKIAAAQATSVVNDAVGAAAVTDSESHNLGSPSIDDPSAVIASLPLQAGRYLVGATFEVFRATSAVMVECELRNGEDRGPGPLRSFDGGGDEANDMGALSLATSGPGAVDLRCTDTTTGFATGGEVEDITIWAIEVPTLTETAG